MHVELDLKYPLNPITARRAANPAQVRFHRMIPQYTVTCFSGGVGSGKTTAGGFEANLLFWKNPGCAGYIVAHNWETLHNVTLPAFLQFLPDWAILNWNKNEKRIDCIGGRTIYYGSAKNPESIEAKNVAWGWGDEIRYWPRRSFERWIARRRQLAPFSRFICTSTPSMGWMFDEFCTNKSGRGIVFCSTEENRENLIDGFLEDLEESFDKRLYETYVGGRFKHLTGGVFEPFDEAVHLSFTLNQLYAPGLPVHAGVDFGLNNPAVILFQHFRHCHTHNCDRCMHVLDEIMPENAPTERLAVMMNERWDERGWEPGIAYVDPAGRGRSQEVGISSIRIMREEGIVCKYPTKSIDTYKPNQVARVNAKLDPQSGKPSMWIAKELDKGTDRGIVRTMRSWQYPTDKEGRITSDSPMKTGGDDHAGDALFYPTVVLNPTAQRKRIR